MNKEVNTNVGILIFLMVAVILVLTDFVVIGYELGYAGSGFKGNFIDDADSSNNSILSEEDVLVIADSLFTRSSELSINYGEKRNNNVFFILDTEGGYTNFIEVNEEDYIGTDTLLYNKLEIDDFKSVFSSQFFESFCLKNSIYEYNGDYYALSGDRGSALGYIDTKLSVVSITENSVLFNAVSSYYSDSDEMRSGVSVSDAKIETKTDIFEIVFENENWKVNQFNVVY